MKDFDLNISTDNIQNEIDSIDTKDINKNWIDTLNVLTKEFKKISAYKTPEQIKSEKQKELAEKGKKYKILGMNPLVAIGLSFAVIISGSVILYKIK